MEKGDIINALAEPGARAVVADIVAHAEPATIEELEWSTGYEPDRVQELVDDLADAGIIEDVTSDDVSAYTVAPGARKVFDRESVFVEEHWQELFAQVEK